MRIGVYDQYWSTLGGGEQFAGGIAAALRDEHAVELLGPEPIDAARFHERLGIDLAGLAFHAMDFVVDVSRASADYDLFVNCTYQSLVVNRATHGLYVVHFPGEVPGRKQRLKDGARGALSGRITTVVLRSGFHQPAVRGGPRRTDGGGVIDVYAPAGTPVTVTVAATSTTGEPTAVEVWRRRERLDAVEVASGADATLAFTASGAWPDQVILESPYHVAPGPNGWPTRFGVELVALTVGPRRLAAPADRLTGKLLAPDRLGNLATYDTVVANSAFTARWVERLWGRHSEVLYPPVRMMPAGAAKEPIILSVGRFFDPARGHSKKQLELVEAFGQLHAAGRLPGWSYHVVGGCNKEDREYAMAVKRAALGLPVHVHVNAPGDVLVDLLGRASLYWHAGGLGEDPERHPFKFEHFGVSVVEAMSAGVVPVVFGAAGPAEIVRDGVDGRHFATIGELLAITAALVGDDAELARLRKAAVERAADFGPDAFTRRLHDVVAGAVSR